MKRKRGQALVEFVIILPIFIFMLLAVIDIGKIIYTKNSLESELSDVLDLYRNHKSYEDIASELALQDKDTVLEIKNQDNETITFYLKKNIDIITPGLNAIFESPYSVTVQRVMSYE